jgi:hypothetical protein
MNLETVARTHRRKLACLLAVVGLRTRYAKSLHCLLTFYSLFPSIKAFRNATACPTFLIATAGPWIVVLGAVITDGVIVQRLTDYVWVGIDSVLNESHITDVAESFML